MSKKKKHRRLKTTLLLLLLAIVCIGGVELLVCRIADPALYERLTAPVRAAFVSLADRFSAPPSPAPEESPTPPDEEQLAGAPALERTDTVSDPAVTRLEIRDNQELLLGGSVEVVYYNQSDPQWSSLSYGSDDIGRYGCGPTVMSMVVSSLTETVVDPASMAAWAVEQRCWAKRNGSYLSIVEKTARGYGLTCESGVLPDAELLRQELAAGKVAVALMTRGHFTERGHFILLRGLTLTGDILVADPNSRDRSLIPWDAQLILDELSASRNDGAPIWFLSLEPAKE